MYIAAAVVFSATGY